MTEPLLRLKAPAYADISVRNSRFFATLLPITDLSEVRGAIDARRAAHPGANHVVPKGTAGRPSLEVLKGSGITNVLLTTVRYFGGVKLGTGGLVRAYAEAVRVVVLVATDSARGAIIWEGPPRSHFS